MATIDVENKKDTIFYTFYEHIYRMRGFVSPCKTCSIIYRGIKVYQCRVCVVCSNYHYCLRLRPIKFLYQARSTRSKRTIFSKFSNLNNLFTYHFGAEDADIGQFWWFFQTLLLILKNHFFYSIVCFLFFVVYFWVFFWGGVKERRISHFTFSIISFIF